MAVSSLYRDIHTPADPKNDFGTNSIFRDIQSDINEGYERGISELPPEKPLEEGSEYFMHGFHCGLKDRVPSEGPYKDLGVENICSLLYNIIVFKELF